MPKKNKRSIPGDFIGHLDVKKNRTSSPRGESPGLPVESSTLSYNGSQKIRLSPVTCVTSPPATNDSMDSSNILSPLNLFSSQQMVIRWGPVSPALLLKPCKAPQENSSPRKTSSRENCNFRRKQVKPDKAAQLMRELTNLVSHSSTCSGPKDNNHRDNGDFELNGVVDCPEVLAELLDTSSSSIDELNPENTLGQQLTTLATDTDSGDGIDQSRVDVCLNYENPLENTECEFWSEAAGVLATQEARGFSEDNSQEPLNPHGFNSPSTHATTSRSLTTRCGSTVSSSRGCLDNPPSNRLPGVASVISTGRIIDSEPTTSVSLDEFDFLLSQVDEGQLRQCESLTPGRVTESDDPPTSSNLYLLEQNPQFCYNSDSRNK